MKPIIKKFAVFLLFAIVVSAATAFVGCDRHKDSMSDADYIFDTDDNNGSNEDTGMETVFTVTYADGDKIVAIKKVAYNSNAENLKLDSTADYEFAGWTLNGENYVFSTPVNKNIKLEACWKAIEHTAKFICNGEVVGVYKFTADNKDIKEPAPLEKSGYKVEWPEYELGSKDIVIYAEYKLITYTVQFFEKPDAAPVCTQYCTVLNKDNITLPPIPERDGYTGEWTNYEIIGETVKVYAEYKPLTSTAPDEGGNTSDNNKPPVEERPDDTETNYQGTTGLKYENIDGGLEVTGYTGTESKIVIPSLYDGKAVISVGLRAFEESSVTEVYICNGLKNIDNYAFYICSSLEKITLPSSLETIGIGAFEHSGIKDIILPEKIKILQKNTFANCLKLESVTLPKGLTEIGIQAFSNCKSLKFIDLSNVTEIKFRAFLDCTSLTDVQLNKDANVDDTAFQIIQ